MTSKRWTDRRARAHGAKNTARLERARQIKAHGGRKDAQEPKVVIIPQYVDLSPKKQALTHAGGFLRRLFNRKTG